ncbi:hypothetical protein FBQ82_10560 [Anaerolineae bacterium CFX7]|nr:hypothetical protein [Anaerolineae bacterium CFX7]
MLRRQDRAATPRWRFETQPIDSPQSPCR